VLLTIRTKIRSFLRRLKGVFGRPSLKHMTARVEQIFLKQSATRYFDGLRHFRRSRRALEYEHKAATRISKPQAASVKIGSFFDFSFSDLRVAQELSGVALIRRSKTIRAYGVYRGHYFNINLDVRDALFFRTVPFNAIVAMVRKSISRAMFSDLSNCA
jgi:hypothetical protein